MRRHIRKLESEDMEKVMKVSQFISAGVFVVLAIILNCNGPDLLLISLAIIMAVNVVVSFFIAGKKNSLRRG